MIPNVFKTSAFLAVAALSAPMQLYAQSIDEVKSDVLSALSTPLPITVIGPLLTRDVIVTEEGDGFRATLEDSTLMGLLPFGDVSIKLVALDDEHYRVSDLQFSKNLDFPGLANISYENMTLDGIWSTKSRSYSALKADLTGLNILPGQGDQGALTLGQLSFDVEKEPDNKDTESRFNITFGDATAKGLGGPDLTIGQAKILMSANGERPVDLYSLLREVIVVTGLSDNGVGLQTLGESLLGNTYDTVDIDVSVNDLDIKNADMPLDDYFMAQTLQAKLNMRDVSARDWGNASLSVHLSDVKQQRLLGDGTFEVEKALVRLGAAELPVAKILAAINTLNNASRSEQVLLSDLLNGFLEIGKLELVTEGKALNVEIRDTNYQNDEWVEDTAFFTAYDDWNARFTFDDFNKNEGAIESRIQLAGGTFTPGPLFDDQDLRHINAWFPQNLGYGGKVSNLNEKLLKELIKDVRIQDLSEPIEIMLPIMLYFSASAIDVEVERNHYETALFNIEQTGSYRVYPAKFMDLAPFEGKFLISMSGFDALVSYFEEVRGDEAKKDYGDEEVFSMLKSMFMVLRNLGEPGNDGAVTWNIERPDVDKSVIVINDTKFYYPELNQFLPLVMLGSTF